MPTNKDRFIVLLAAKEHIMEEMAHVLTEEQSRIMEMNSGAVEESNRRKEEVSTRLNRAVAECRQLMEVVGSERGGESGDTLSNLITLASDAERHELVPLQRRLLLLAGTLVRQQDLNRKMLIRSMGLIQRSLSLFGGFLGFADTYGAGGRVSTGSAGVRFLRREI